MSSSLQFNLLVAREQYTVPPEGWPYVAAVIDLFSRRVVGWSMSAAMTAQLVTDTLVMAIWRRGKPDALLHHSDRGSQGPRDGCGAGEQARTAPDADCGLETRGGREAGPGVRRQGRRAGEEPGWRDHQASRQDRPACCGAGFFIESLRSLSLDRRKTMIDPDHSRLSIVRQCELASISRSSFYRASTVANEATLRLMRLLDEQFLETPWYGSRQMVRHLRRNGWCVGRHRVRRLMTKMGLAPIYQRPKTSEPHPAHRIPQCL